VGGKRYHEGGAFRAEGVGGLELGGHLLCHRLPPRADREHACLDADGADVGAGRVRAEPREQLEADVPLAVHRSRVDLQQNRQVERIRCEIWEE